MARIDFSTVQATFIRNELVWNLLRSGSANPSNFVVWKHGSVLHGQHGANDNARHLLTFLLRYALKIVRRPGLYESPRLRTDVIEALSDQQIELAAHEIRRLYQHTQAELKKVPEVMNTITLGRGFRSVEAEALVQLFVELPDDPEIPLYLRTFSFWNCNSACFAGVTVRAPVPLPWVFACNYTVADMHNVTDEEFLVVPTSINGLLQIPRSAVNADTLRIEEAHLRKERGFRSEFALHPLPNCLPKAFSALVCDGLEPDDAMRPSDHRIGKQSPFNKLVERIRSFRRR